MRGLVFEGPGRIGVHDDLPDPEVVAPTDVVVRVRTSGICGSDLHPYRGVEPAAAGVVPGHEAVGEVVDVGADVGLHTIGDRVLVPFTTSCGACEPCVQGRSSRCELGQLFGWGDPDVPGNRLHGAQAQFVRVPLADGTAVTVPEGMSDDTAVLLTDNLPTAWSMARRAGVVDGSRVAVIGLGALGLSAVAAARAQGAVRVVAIDRQPDRATRAEALGAQAWDGREEGFADVVLEAAGPPDAQALAARLARVGGSIATIAVQTADTLGYAPVLAYDRDLTIAFGRAPVRSVLDEVITALDEGTLEPPTQTVVTGHVPLDDGPAAYARAARPTRGAVKTLVDPWA